LVANVKAEFTKWNVNNIEVISDAKLHQRVSSEPIAVLFVDEAHRFANEKSRRSKALYRIQIDAQYVVLMSGTPMPNSRPIELWPILKHFAPDVFRMSFWEYARKFCDMQQGPFGTSFDGFTNQAEFKARLYRSFMIRMDKRYLDLPEKREGLITVGDSMPPIVSRVEKEILKAYTKKDLTEKLIAQKEKVPELHLAKYLRLLGEYKLKWCYPIIDKILTETDEKLILFALHKDVIEALSQHCAQFQPIVLTGATPMKERKKLVDRFQDDPGCRLAIMNITVGGLGWNMTAADRVIFVEHSWRDGDNGQAGDRAHRIGRTKSVLVQYIVLKDSLDAHRMSVVLTKRQNAV
jgi:SWI/SNF-related matrix-associated actin-dependent regulator 1 of chromatin subfamily A